MPGRLWPHTKSESLASEVYGGLNAFVKTIKQLTGNDDTLPGRLWPHISKWDPWNKQWLLMAERKCLQLI
jgi:hypothetical protein